MNSLISLQSDHSARKDQLHSQISEAIEAKDEKLLFYLEGIWVHRYGLTSLESYKYHVDYKHNPEEFDQSPEHQNSKDSSYEKLVQVRTSLTSSAESEERVVQSEDFVEATFLNETSSCNSLQNDLSANQAIEENSNQVVESIDNSNEFVSPPPPSIRRFRRWLPSVDDEAAKAS